MKMAVKGQTKARIRDAAELLFAEHGFNETSLRTITSKAGVNLASVNYHYGDKKTLIRAVLDRYLEQFVPVLIQELEALLSRDEITMEEVFHCIKRPLVELDDFRSYGASIYVFDWSWVHRRPRSLALVYHQSLFRCTEFVY